MPHSSESGKTNETENPCLLYEGDKILIQGVPLTHGPITEERVAEFRRQYEKVNPHYFIAEYFDPDIPDILIKNTINNNALGAYTITKEVEYLMQSADLNPKKIVCLDPAHDDMWFIIDGILMEGSSALSLSIAEVAYLRLNSTSKVTRRNLLKATAGMAGLFAVESVGSWGSKAVEQITSTPINHPINPQALRRLVIARNILLLDKLLKANSPNDERKLNFLLYYPQTHLDGIGFYLRNWNYSNQLDSNTLAIISDYGTARIYSRDADSDKWKKQVLKL